jgi:hypothetical protein
MYHLGNEPVQIGVGGSLDIQGAAADVIDSFIIEHNSYIGVLQQ